MSIKLPRFYFLATGSQSGSSFNRHSYQERKINKPRTSRPFARSQLKRESLIKGFIYETAVFIIAFGIALSQSVPALAEFHSLSASYLHSFIKIKTGGTEVDAGALDGINVKYRYEWVGPLSLIGSLSYMTANAYSRQVSENSFQEDDRYRYSAVSLTAGPAWRFNEYVSL